MPLKLLDNALFIDNSSLEKYTTCPRSAKFYLVDRREGSEERTALGFGGRIHSILESRYRHHVNVVEETTNVMRNKAAEVFKDWQAGEDDFRTYSTALQFIDLYNLQYPVEAFDIVNLGTIPAIEVPFAVPLGEVDLDGNVIKVVWTGRIDLVYQREGQIYLMDHKTTSMLGPTYFKEFELSSQVFGYVWAIQQLLGVKVNGFVVNALAIRKPTKTGKGFEFIRHIVPIDQALVEEWHEETMDIVSNMLEMDRADKWPGHKKWCVGKYGVCEYAPICGLPPAQRPILLGSPAYRDVTWSPLK